MDDGNFSQTVASSPPHPSLPAEGAATQSQRLLNYYRNFAVHRQKVTAARVAWPGDDEKGGVAWPGDDGSGGGVALTEGNEYH